MSMASNSSRLYRKLVDESMPIVKRAQQLARLIEENFIRESWPAGKSYGSEREIARKYCVGRLVARDAIRILQRRGEIQMRPGPGGGVILVAPSEHAVMQEVGNYLSSIGATLADLLEARHVVESVMLKLEVSGRGANGAARLAGLCIEELVRRLGRFNAETAPNNKEPAGVTTRAGQLAREIAAEISRHKMLQGERLGTEEGLAGRCGVSRAVMRQAIRLLEDCGIVAQQRGRGRGVSVRRPQSGTVVRQLCAYMSANGVTMMQSYDVYKLLHLELTKLAARKLTEQDDARLARLADELRDWQGSLKFLAAGDIECEVAVVARNPVLDLLFRMLQAFGVWKRLPRPAFSLAQLPAFKAKALAVIDALRRRDSRASVEAQCVKREFLEAQLWWPGAPPLQG
jgi:DNA-binding FadR family transcriptional regulator